MTKNDASATGYAENDIPNVDIKFQIIRYVEFVEKEASAGELAAGFEKSSGKLVFCFSRSGLKGRLAPVFQKKKKSFLRKLATATSRTVFLRGWLASSEVVFLGSELQQFRKCFS